MKLLLDTCTFLWIYADAKELSSTARELFLSPKNLVCLSSVSSWEILIKNTYKECSISAIARTA